VPRCRGCTCESPKQDSSLSAGRIPIGRRSLSRMEQPRRDTEQTGQRRWSGNPAQPRWTGGTVCPSWQYGKTPSPPSCKRQRRSSPSFRFRSTLSDAWDEDSAPPRRVRSSAHNRAEAWDERTGASRRMRARAHWIAQTTGRAIRVAQATGELAANARAPAPSCPINIRGWAYVISSSSRRRVLIVFDSAWNAIVARAGRVCMRRVDMGCIGTAIAPVTRQHDLHSSLP
jgi:hypothetical protein